MIPHPMTQQPFLSFEQIQTARRYADRAERLVQKEDQFTLYPVLGGVAVAYLSSYADSYDVYVGKRTLDAMADLRAEGMVYRTQVPDDGLGYPSARRFVTVTKRDGIETEEGQNLDLSQVRLLGQVVSGEVTLYTGK